MILHWITNNYIEIFGAVTGILYVFLEIRQTSWLWPVGIITSAAYIWIFFNGKLYADMGLQGYYLVISVLGWYWWTGKGKQDPAGAVNDSQAGHSIKLQVTRTDLKTGALLATAFIILFSVMEVILDHFTDSPVPAFDSFITSLSVTATWMLARKLYEHWYLWIVVNLVASVLFLTRGLYATVILYLVYFIMSFAGLNAWRKTIISHSK